jgi:hypothetical protein
MKLGVVPTTFLKLTIRLCFSWVGKDQKPDKEVPPRCLEIIR